MDLVFFDEDNPQSVSFFIMQMGKYFKTIAPKMTPEQEETMKKLQASAIQAVCASAKDQQIKEAVLCSLFDDNRALKLHLEKIESGNPDVARRRQIEETYNELIADNETLHQLVHKLEKKVIDMSIENTMMRAPLSHQPETDPFPDSSSIDFTVTEKYVMPLRPFDVVAFAEGFEKLFKQCAPKASEEELMTMKQLKNSFHHLWKEQFSKLEVQFNNTIAEKTTEYEAKISSAKRMTTEVLSVNESLKFENNQLRKEKAALQKAADKEHKKGGKGKL